MRRTRIAFTSYLKEHKIAFIFSPMQWQEHNIYVITFTIDLTTIPLPFIRVLLKTNRFIHHDLWFVHFSCSKVTQYNGE